MSSQERNNYVHTIDLLRGIAALMVCYFHFTSNTAHYGSYLPDGNILKTTGSYGWLGVEIFFVISGFVIPYSLYNSNYSLHKVFSFLKKRWLRIEPPYIVTIFLILINWKFYGWLWAYDVDIDWKQVLSHFIYIPQFIGYPWINEIFWTLAIEFQFYLFIAISFVGFNHPKKLIKLLTCALFILPHFVFNDNRFVFSYSSLFLLGISAFWYRTQTIGKGIYSLLVIGFTVLATLQFPNENITIPLVALVTSVIIAFVNFRSVVGQFTGKISYSLYLTHGLIGGNFLLFSMYLEQVKSSEMVRSILIFAAIFISIIFAYIFYICVEKPSQNLSKNKPIKLHFGKLNSKINQI